MKFLFPILIAGSLVACSQAQVNTALQTPTGALFCAIQTAGGGTMIVTVADAAAVTASPTAAPVALLATGVAKAVVDADCAAAGPGGVAVSPPVPATVVPTIAVVVPPVAAAAK